MFGRFHIRVSHLVCMGLTGAALMACAVLPSRTVYGGVIIEEESCGGPGGSCGMITVNPGTNLVATDVGHDETSNDAILFNPGMAYLDLQFRVENEATNSISEFSFEQDITNLSGHDWIGFRHVLGFTVEDATPFVAGDTDGDGQVNGGDLSVLLGNWLAVVRGGSSDGDFDESSQVNGGDLSVLLGNWLQSAMLAGPDFMPSNDADGLDFNQTLLGVSAATAEHFSTILVGNGGYDTITWGEEGPVVHGETTTLAFTIDVPNFDPLEMPGEVEILEFDPPPFVFSGYVFTLRQWPISEPVLENAGNLAMRKSLPEPSTLVVVLGGFVFMARHQKR